MHHKKLIDAVSPDGLTSRLGSLGQEMLSWSSVNAGLDRTMVPSWPQTHGSRRLRDRSSCRVSSQIIR